MIGQLLKSVLFSAGVALIWSGCKKDEDPVDKPKPIINEEEVITTMKLIFTDSADASNIKMATFRDPDGDGGATYDIFDDIVLEANKTWYTNIILLNETASPVDTISNEVEEEKNDHRFCYTPTGTSASVTILDFDDNGYALGLQSKWITGAAGNGAMQIELRHQPGIKDGSCSPGATDIDVNFPVVIQ
ncbi:MAG: hypothetical protein KDC13_03840 [Bacteroidetes bacterium]|nr:hypothetical protein [Bacteroidota bacterium]